MSDLQIGILLGAWITMAFVPFFDNSQIKDMPFLFKVLLGLGTPLLMVAIVCRQIGRFVQGRS